LSQISAASSSNSRIAARNKSGGNSQASCYAFYRETYFASVFFLLFPALIDIQLKQNICGIGLGPGARTWALSKRGCSKSKTPAVAGV
jgi:hypothetical protein